MAIRLCAAHKADDWPCNPRTKSALHSSGLPGCLTALDTYLLNHSANLAMEWQSLLPHLFGL